MTDQSSTSTEKKRWTARELRKLPASERDAIMTAAAQLAESDYRNNPELTAFEAFGGKTFMAKAPTPRRGDVWLIDFDPSVGAEIQKIRPAVVISMDNIGRCLYA